MSGVRITLLCEDSQTDSFVRRFLRRRNFRGRDVRTLPLPKGRQSGEQWVRERYPAELRTIRGRRGAWLIVVTDADDHSTNDRRGQLDAACQERNVPARTDADPVILIVPRRNIETWLAYLDAGKPVDEAKTYQPVAKSPLHSTGAASRLNCVVRRSNMANMLPPHALSAGRPARLGATRGFTTGCYPRLRRARDCDRHAGTLFGMCRGARQLDAAAPPSLREACEEYGRLRQ